MTLDEIIEHMLLETGQHILEDLSNLELDKHKFWLLINRSLSYYEKHCSLIKNEVLMITSKHRFIYEDVLDQDGVIIDRKRIPRWISSCHKLGNSNFSPIPSPHVRMTLFKYIKPDLIINDSGNFEVTSHYDYERILTKDSDNKVTDVDLPYIDLQDSSFLNHLRGNFMVSLGSSRKAFVLNDMPIQTDGSDLVSDGKELIEKSEESITNNNDWSYSLGQ